jgi:hypothetical protein
MPFIKGELKPRQGSGRPRGSTNETTKQVKQIMLDIINDNLDQIRLDIMQLEPRDRCAVIIQLAKLILPKVKPLETENEQSDNLPIPIEINFNQLGHETNN